MTAPFLHYEGKNVAVIDRAYSCSDALRATSNSIRISSGKEWPRVIDITEFLIQKGYTSQNPGDRPEIKEDSEGSGVPSPGPGLTVRISKQRQSVAISERRILCDFF